MATKTPPWSACIRCPARRRGWMAGGLAALLLVSARPARGGPTEIDLWVLGQDRLTAGQPSWLRILVRASRGMLRSLPLPLASLEIELSGPGRSQRLLSARSDLLGTLEARFAVPDWPAGEYSLSVSCKSPFGDRRLSRAVRLEAERSASVSGASGPPRPRPAPVDMAPGPSLAIAPEGGRLVAGVDNRLLVQVRDGAGQPARATVRLRRGEREAGAVTLEPDGRGFLTVRPAIDDLETAGAPVPVSFAPGFELPAAARRGPPRIWTARVEGSLPSGEKLRQDLRLPAWPESDRLLLRLNRNLLRPGDTAVATVFSPEDGACMLEIFENGRVRDGRTLAIQNGRAEFRFSPDRPGDFWLQAWRLMPDGSRNLHAVPLRVESDQTLAIVFARDRARYRPGDEAIFRVLAVDERGRATGATMAWNATIRTDGTADGDTEPSGDLCPPRAEPAGPPELALWHNPFEERRLAAEADRRAIQSALYRRLEQGRPLGERGPDGRWRYSTGLFDELLRENLLPPERSRDRFGEPYDSNSIGELWPELAPEVFLPSQDLNRLLGLRATLVARLQKSLARDRSPAVPLSERIRHELDSIATTESGVEYLQSVTGQPYTVDRLLREAFPPAEIARELLEEQARELFSALSRYRADSERWYRAPICPPAGPCRLPPDILDRLLMRGWLRADAARDLWGRPLRIVQDEAAALSRLSPPDGVAVVSDGEDGQPLTDDDLRLEPGAADGGLRFLSRWLGLWDPSPPAEVAPAPSPAPVAAAEAAEASTAVLRSGPAAPVDERGLTIRLPLPAEPGAVRLRVVARDGRGRCAAATHTIELDPGAPDRR